MKTYLLATLGALLLLAPALAGAATTGQPDNQPQSNVVIASTVPTPSPSGSLGSQPAPAYAYQGNVPVSATIPGGWNNNAGLRDSTAALMNQTGGGR